MTRIAVDFNDFEPDGRLTALVDDADGPILLGDRVVLGDSDGNRCQAAVDEIQDNGVVFLEMDWSSWNRVNTLLDVLSEAVAAVRGFRPDEPFDPTPTGLDLPRKTVSLR